MKKMLISLLLLVLLIGCSTSRQNEASEAPSYDEDVDWSEPGQVQNGDSSGFVDPTKIIKSAEYSIETRRFDENIDTLTNLVDDIDGFIETSSVSRSSFGNRLRNGYYRLRIPSEQFNFFTQSVKEQFTVISESTMSQSVAESYYDAQSRIKVLEVQQERLLELVESASNVEEIVFLQNQLMEVENELDSHKSTIQRLDNQIDYSSITLTIRELDEDSDSVTEDNFFNQLGRAFSRGFSQLGVNLSNLILFIAENLITVLIMVAAVVIVIRKLVKPKKKKIEKEEEQES